MRILGDAIEREPPGRHRDQQDAQRRQEGAAADEHARRQQRQDGEHDGRRAGALENAHRQLGGRVHDA